MMHVYLTRISPTHHRFEIERADGSRESHELETKTFWFHDLLHFAVEREARLSHSFYGMLARGKTYDSLTDETMIPADRILVDEIGITERIVGGLTRVLKNNIEGQTFIDTMKNWFDATNEPLPAWLTPGYIERVRERMRRLLGEWNALPFGETMKLTFDIE